MRLDDPIPSRLRVILISLLISFFVLGISLVIQWLVYDDWLHRTGPLRIVGTSIAAIITFASILRWQYSLRERQRELIRRFELISHMNDRIRNALQAIECLTYIAYPEETGAVRREVDAIDTVLREVLSDAGMPSARPVNTDSLKASQKSA